MGATFEEMGSTILEMNCEKTELKEVALSADDRSIWLGLGFVNSIKLKDQEFYLMDLLKRPLKILDFWIVLKLE
jgi:hypothetical protein